MEPTEQFQCASRSHSPESLYIQPTLDASVWSANTTLTEDNQPRGEAKCQLLSLPDEVLESVVFQLVHADDDIVIYPEKARTDRDISTILYVCRRLRNIAKPIFSRNFYTQNIFAVHIQDDGYMKRPRKFANHRITHLKIVFKESPTKYWNNTGGYDRLWRNLRDRNSLPMPDFLDDDGTNDEWYPGYPMFHEGWRSLFSQIQRLDFVFTFLSPPEWMDRFSVDFIHWNMCPSRRSNTALTAQNKAQSLTDQTPHVDDRGNLLENYRARYKALLMALRSRPYVDSTLSTFFLEHLVPLLPKLTKVGAFGLGNPNLICEFNRYLDALQQYFYLEHPSRVDMATMDYQVEWKAIRMYVERCEWTTTWEAYHRSRVPMEEAIETGFPLAGDEQTLQPLCLGVDENDWGGWFQ